MSDDLASYFLDSTMDIVQLELLEFSHPNFSQTYRIVRNAREGVTVDLSPEELGVQFDFYPTQVSTINSSDDLDSSLSIQFGDLGEVLPDEMDNLARRMGFLTKPTIRYWVYRSDDLTQPIFGPVLLEAGSMDFGADGAQFNAEAPQLNINKTGEIYKLERFPMLRGYL